MESPLWTAAEAARLSGWTVHMLDYLARADVLLPAVPARGQRRHGRPRKYRFGDIVVLTALRALTARGVSVLRLRPALKAIRPIHAQITPAKVPARYLLTCGNAMTFAGPARVAAQLSKLGPAALLLDVESIRKTLVESIGQEPVV